MDTKVVSRELSRVRRYAHFGSEFIHFESRSIRSLNRLLFEDPIRIQRKSRVKCIQFLWNVCADDETLAEALASTIESVVMATDNKNHSLAVLILTLFDCQKPKQNQSSFRRLSIKLLLQKASIVDVFMLMKIEGKKLKAGLKATVNEFYSRDKTEEQKLEMILNSRHFGWNHLDVIRLCHIKMNPFLKSLVSKDEPTEDGVVIDVRALKNESTSAKTIEEILRRRPKFDWSRVINTHQLNDVKIWLILIEFSSIELIFLFIPKIIKRFPNNEKLLQKICQRITDNEIDVTWIKREFILKSIEFESSKESTKLLLNCFKFKENRKKMSQKIIFSIDSNSVPLKQKLNEPEPSRGSSRQNRHDDVFDRFSIADFLSIVIRYFGESISGFVDNRLETIGNNNHVTLVEKLEKLDAKQSSDLISIAIEKSIVIHVTQTPFDPQLWPSEDRKLIVLHVKKLKLSEVSFRENVLVINGFDSHVIDLIVNFIEMSLQSK